MSYRIKIWFLFILLTGCCVAEDVHNEIKCDQNFVLFDKTIGEYSLIFYRVDWEGAAGCGRRTFYTLFLIPDRVHSFSSDRLYGNWVPKLYDNLPLEDFEILNNKNDLYYLNDSAFFKLPHIDTTFETKFNALPKRSTKTWYWENRDNTDIPVFSGVSYEGIYYHEGGLYKNYNIREARYYRKSGYLILLTEQPLRDYENKTMNGLMIFKIWGG